MPLSRFAACRIALTVAAVGCASARPSTPTFVMGAAGAIARARVDSLRYPYTQADIDFMRGMIHHHAQAIMISRWAPTHGATASVQRLTARIINAQSDEITLMRTWLADRNQIAPNVDSTGQVTVHRDTPAMAGHDMAAMPGMRSMAVMPGMLDDAQMRELDAARGTTYDRLFLTFMMQHHRGAVAMVTTLFSSQGAGQDESVFKFASDVEVDQSTEIRRMLSMMLEMGFAPPLL